MSTSPANIIQLIELDDGQHYVEVTMDGHELERRGPYSSADEAEAMAERIAGICRVFHQPMSVMPAPARKRCA